MNELTNAWQHIIAFLGISERDEQPPKDQIWSPAMCMFWNTPARRWMSEWECITLYSIHVGWVPNTVSKPFLSGNADYRRLTSSCWAVFRDSLLLGMQELARRTYLLSPEELREASVTKTLKAHNTDILSPCLQEGEHSLWAAMLSDLRPFRMRRVFPREPEAEVKNDVDTAHVDTMHSRPSRPPPGHVKKDPPLVA